VISPKPKKPAYIIALQQFRGGATAGKRFILLIILIGWVVLVANAIWIVYRLVKGFLNLNDGKPMYQNVMAG
jgi:hypothetical protein